MAYQEPNKDGFYRKIRRTFRPRNIDDSIFGVGEGLPWKVRRTQVSKRN